MYVCMYVCMNAFKYVCMCMHVCISVWMYVCLVYIYMHEYICMYVCMHACMCVFMCICAYVRMHQKKLSATFTKYQTKFLRNYQTFRTRQRKHLTSSFTARHKWVEKCTECWLVKHCILLEKTYIKMSATKVKQRTVWTQTLVLHMESYETDTQIDLTKTIFFSSGKNESRKRMGPLFFVVRKTSGVEIFFYVC
jgi:hypothetical protein